MIVPKQYLIAQDFMNTVVILLGILLVIIGSISTPGLQTLVFRNELAFLGFISIIMGVIGHFIPVTQEGFKVMMNMIVNVWAIVISVFLMIHLMKDDINIWLKIFIAFFLIWILGSAVHLLFLHIKSQYETPA